MNRACRLIAFFYIFIAPIIAAGCSHGDDNWLEVDDVSKLPYHPYLNPTSRYIVVIGDIQEYTSNADFMNRFSASMDWLRYQQWVSGNIDVVLQVGDLTNDNADWQWRYGLLAMRPVAESMPMIAVTGNHDYTWQRTDDNYLFISDRKSTLFNQYLLPIHRDMTLVETFEPGRRENALYSLSIGGRKSFILALEFATPPAAVEWAEKLLKAHPDTDFYLVTHEWLNSNGSFVGDAESYARRQFHDPARAATPREIWSKIVYPYNNLIAVICGHNGFVQWLFSPNAEGRLVPQILFNLQYQENGGNSLIQLWEMPQGSDSVHTSVFHVESELPLDDIHTKVSFSRSPLDRMQ